MNSLVNDITQDPFNVSRLDDLCIDYKAKSRCALDFSPCVDNDSTIGDPEKLYSAAREDACSDRNRNLLKSLIPSAACPALPLLLSCVVGKLQEFRNESTATESSCSDAHGLTSSTPGETRPALSGVGPDCPLDRHRHRYARRTLGALQEVHGCPSPGSNPVSASADPGTTQGRCSYKQLKRCLDRQAYVLPGIMAGLLTKKKTPLRTPGNPVCRRTRAQCHQHNVLDSCRSADKDTIRRMEEAMDVAQATLCEKNGTLFQNLIFSYKSWNGHHFKKCSTDNHVGSITVYLFGTRRLERDCRELRQRMYRCFNESVTLVIEEGDPQPDVSGARKVLAAFLDRIPCIGNQGLPQDGGGRDVHRSSGDVDYPEDRTSYPGDEAKGTRSPVVLAKPSSGAASFRLRTVVFLGLIALWTHW
ncbi:uncharacterized protein LOC144168786 isoform X1 [Haemaphysalis longicornis]